MTSSLHPRLVPVADCAVLVIFGDDIDADTVARVAALDRALCADPPVGMTEVVPAMTTLAVVFDPLATDHEAITAAVADRLDAPATTTSGLHHVIEMCADADCAPDLSAVADRTRLAPDEVVAAHLAATYTVGMYGFAPGFAYLYGTPPAIQLPRNPTPGPPVAAGSVIIAGQQCLITPVAMSTGWFAIGRTATRVLTDDPDRPFLFDVGDTVSFRLTRSA